MAPTTVSVFRGKDHRVEATLGDQRGSTTLAQRLMIPVVLLDFCTLGIGLLIDYVSGTLYDFQPSVRINLGKAPALLDDLARELDARQCHSVLVGSRLSSDADAALLIDTAIQTGFEDNRLRPMEFCGDQGTAAITREIISIVEEVRV